MNADIQLQPLISAFIAHLSNERQLSPHTVDGYQRDLTALKKDLAGQDIADWRDVSAHHLRTYIGAGKRQGRSGKTLQRRLSALAPSLTTWHGKASARQTRQRSFLRQDQTRACPSP